MIGDRLQHLGHLNGQFAGRHQDEPERTHRLSLIGDASEHRHAECERLARAGLRATAHVVALHGNGDRFGLDVEWLGEPARGESVVDAGRDAELKETGWCLDGRE